METSEYISKKIKELRMNSGMKQADLGALLSTPRKAATISSWECGRTKPDDTDLLDLCEIFGIDIVDLYPPTKRDYQVIYSDNERELISYFRQLPERAQRAVLIGLSAYATPENFHL